MAKLYQEVQMFLTLLANPAEFARALQTSIPEWLHKNNIDLKDFKDKACQSPTFRRAAKHFEEMRKEGYEPQNESEIAPYIQNFFYNRVTQQVPVWGTATSPTLQTVAPRRRKKDNRVAVRGRARACPQA